MSDELQRMHIRPGLRLETLKLIEKLKAGKIGDVLTDGELTELCGKCTRVGGEGYAYLLSAIKYVLREHGLVWRRVTGEDTIKCLDAKEVRSKAAADRQSTSRRGKRTVRQIQAVYDTADETTRAALNRELSTHGALVAMASNKMQKKLEARNPVAEPNPRALLEALVDVNATGRN